AQRLLRRAHRPVRGRGPARVALVRPRGVADDRTGLGSLVLAELALGRFDPLLELRDGVVRLVRSGPRPGGPLPGALRRPRGLARLAPALAALRPQRGGARLRGAPPRRLRRARRPCRLVSSLGLCRPGLRRRERRGRAEAAGLALADEPPRLEQRP